MTRPKGIGRGGKRQNAGRPSKKKPAPQAPKNRSIYGVQTIARTDREELTELAYRTLKEIMADVKLPPAPRVTAAKAVIAGSVGSAAGKKEAAHRAAIVAGAGTDWGDDLDPARVN